jgi:arylsulfatase A-like enzyme
VLSGPRAFLAALAGGLAACGDTPERRPNIVLLISDDQDYEQLGFLGNALAHTPTIDALAASGVAFTHAFAPMSRCRPAQAALLSGEWPHQSGVYFNVGADHIDPETSLANRLHAAGYACFGAGKFWEFDPHRMGFVNYTIRDYETFVRLGQRNLFEFLEGCERAQPFFVWWAPELPHEPHDPPERFLALVDRAAIPIPVWYAGDPEAYRDAEWKSLAMVAWLDASIAELRAKLDELGELDDTLFLFWIDNGWANGLPSKGTAYDKGLRTPCVLSWPAGIPGGKRCSELVSPVDLHATLLDYAGLEIPPSSMGSSLRPWIEDQAFAPRDALFGALYTQTPAEPEARAERDAWALWARTRRWKYVLYLRDVRSSDDRLLRIQAELCPYPERSRGDEDLFDLEQDPYELADLSDRPEHRALMDELRAGILAWWQATGGKELELP